MGSMEARDTRQDLKMAPGTALPSETVPVMVQNEAYVSKVVGRACDASFAMAALWAIMVMIVVEWAKDRFDQVLCCCLPEPFSTAISDARAHRQIKRQESTMQTDPEPVPSTRDAACQTELSMIDQAIDLIRDTANAIPNVIKGRLPQRILLTPEKSSVDPQQKSKCLSEPTSHTRPANIALLSEFNRDWLDIDLGSINI